MCKRPKFSPPNDWLTALLIVALRYKRNYGVFWKAGNYHTEPVTNGRVYVFTTDLEVKRRKKKRIPLPNVPPII